MKEIQLTQNQVALVDDWRYEEENTHKWYAWWSEDTQSFYAVRTEGNKKNQKTIYMHREIAKTPKEMLCDHKNHNTLDNQEHNLRNVTHSQNQMNGRLRSDNKLREKCISPHGSGFRVEVHKDGKRVFRETFATIEDARSARDDAITKNHGEYANLK